MTEAQKILTMIEAVDPADTKTLDEIDARVWCYINNEQYLRHARKQAMGLVATHKTDDVYGWNHVSNIPLYTRSRDALKAIRPEGWCNAGIIHRMGGWCMDLYNNRLSTRDSVLSTEELAELHAIIQAIEYDRSNQ